MGLRTVVDFQDFYLEKSFISHSLDKIFKYKEKSRQITKKKGIITTKRFKHKESNFEFLLCSSF